MSTYELQGDRVTNSAGTGAPTATFGLTLPPANQTDSNATAAGQKQYLWNVAYNGSITPSLSGPTGLSVVRGVFIPYQMQDGTWRLRFSFRAAITSATSANVSLNGVTTKNVSNNNQAVSASQQTNTTAAIVNAHTSANSSVIAGLVFSGAVADISAAGDIELDSKPTWAY